MIIKNNKYSKEELDVMNHNVDDKMNMKQREFCWSATSSLWQSGGFVLDSADRRACRSALSRLYNRYHVVRVIVLFLIILKAKSHVVG